VRSHPSSPVWAALCTVCLLSLSRSAPADLRSDLESLTQSSALRYAQVGVLVVDLGSGETLYAHDPDTRVNPASNQKIITTAAAHELLGPTFVYQTKVLAETKPGTDGVVKGNLYLRGSGDPSVTHDDIDALAARISKAGVRRVTGSIVADTSAFDDGPLGTGWSHDYLDDYYAAEVSALTVDGGCVTVIVRGADRAGKAPLMRLEPYSDYLTLAPGSTTTGGDAKPRLYRHLGRNIVALSGPIGVGQRVESTLTVRQPGLHAATLLLLALKRAGTAVAGGVAAGKTPESAVELGWHDSQPLSRLIATVNLHSDNNYAEAIQRTISLAKSGVGSCTGSVDYIDKWAEGFGADSKAFLMYDGCGLSRMNSVTPRFLVQVLSHMGGNAGWVGTLPVMGRTGTLAGRLKGTEAAGRVQAKTGYIAGTRALSGYVSTKSGRRLAFSMLVGNSLGTDGATHMQNEMCLRLAGI